MIALYTLIICAIASNAVYGASASKSTSDIHLVFPGQPWSVAKGDQKIEVHNGSGEDENFLAQYAAVNGLIEGFPTTLSEPLSIPGNSSQVVTKTRFLTKKMPFPEGIFGSYAFYLTAIAHASGVTANIGKQEREILFTRSEGASTFSVQKK